MKATDLIAALNREIAAVGDREVWVIPSMRMRADLVIASSDEYYTGRFEDSVIDAIADGSYMNNPPVGIYIDYTEDEGWT